MDGKSLSDKIKDELKCEIDSHQSIPCLAVITVGENEASEVYVKSKKKACEFVKIGFLHIHYDCNTEENKIIKKIRQLNKDKNINGIIVQLPLPKSYNIKKIVNEISFIKDVDGLTDASIIKSYNNEEIFTPCTAAGVIEILDYYKIDIESKSVVIVGRSNLVGKPLFFECLKRNANITICHSKTKSLEKYTKIADILIVATGKKHLIDCSMIKKGSVIIDIGISREGNKIYGDVNPNVDDLCLFKTPVPGGIGPMTVSMLLKNTYKAYRIQNNIN